MIKVGIPIFNDVEELDFTGPFEVMSYMNKIKPGSTEVFLVSQYGGDIRCFNGLKVMSDYSFESSPRCDVLIVPGEKGRITEMKNETFLDYVKKMDNHTKFTASVCTGAFILANAGLLSGRKATTYHTAFDELKEYKVDVIKSKVVKDGKYVTGAGVSSGIDLGIFLLKVLFGAEAAQIVSRKIEYEVRRE